MIAVYFFAGILLVLLAAVLVSPLVESRSQGPATEAGRRLEDALDTLRELEFEHETGKISDAEYRSLRAEFAREAIAARDAGAGEGQERKEQEAAAGCPVCDASPAAGAKYCPRCGTSLVPAAG